MNGADYCSEGSVGSQNPCTAWPVTCPNAPLVLVLWPHNSSESDNYARTHGSTG